MDEQDRLEIAGAALPTLATHSILAVCSLPCCPAGFLLLGVAVVFFVALPTYSREGAVMTRTS